MLQMCNHAAFWARSSPLPPLPLCLSLSFLHFPSKAGRRQGQSEKFSTSQGITSTSYVTHCVLGRHQSQLMKGHQLLYRLTRLRQKSLVERGMFARVHINHSETLAGCACSLLALSSPKKRKRKSMQYPAARLLTFGLTLPRQSRQQRKFRDWHSKRTLRERVEPNGKDGKNHWDSRQQSLKFNAPNHGLLCLN